MHRHIRMTLRYESDMSDLCRGTHQAAHNTTQHNTLRSLFHTLNHEFRDAVNTPASDVKWHPAATIPYSTFTTSPAFLRYDWLEIRTRRLITPIRRFMSKSKSIVNQN